MGVSDMLEEDVIKKELKQMEEYLLFDRELGQLPNDFIAIINCSDYCKADAIRRVLKHVLDGGVSNSSQH